MIVEIFVVYKRSNANFNKFMSFVSCFCYRLQQSKDCARPQLVSLFSTLLLYNFSMTTNVNIQEINNGLTSNVKLRDINVAVHYFFLMTLTCV